ncbi:MAG: GAF domain-containing protein [Chloroflexi bacterium]|nr:GAF domain-containing protein [Chloroflexota bacterium]
MTQIEFGALLDAIPEAVIVADHTSEIVYANTAVEGLLGWSPSELVGSSLHSIQPDRMHDAHDRGFRRYVSTGTKTLFDGPIHLPARRRDGTERDVELSLAEVADADGTPLVVGVLRGATEQVDLERHIAILRYLKATTAAHTRLWTKVDPSVVLQTLTDVLVDDFDAALARTWIHDPETNTLRLQTSGGITTRIKGSTREVIDIATSPAKVAVVAREREPFIRVGLGGNPAFDQEFVARERIVSVIALPLVAGDQLLGAMVGFFRHAIPDEVAETIGHLAALAAATINDARLVAQEREAREEADRARGHFELLARVSERLVSSLSAEVSAQSLVDTVVPDFADWCIVDLVTDGPSLRAIASRHADPRVADHIAELRATYPPAEDEEPPHPIHRAISEGETVWESVEDGDLAARARDPRHLELLRAVGIGSHVVVPLVGRGAVMGAISFVRSASRPPFETDDVATAEDITRRAALAIDNAQLYRSAEQAVALRDRFLAVASHELRTPLSVVRGHWELLGRRLAAEGSDPDTQRQQLEASVRRLGQGIDQLQRLVEDLLDADRLRGQAVDLKPTELDMTMVVRETIEDLHDPAMRDRVRTILPDEPVDGVWDRARLAQVIGNLIGNALKYSPDDGNVEVEVTTREDVVRIRVTDSGIGIAAEQLDAIFEPFTRAPNAAAQHYPGLGLGLAVSREIVMTMGGRMWAESPGEGRGSTFTIELPRRPAAAAEAERAAP